MISMRRPRWRGLIWRTGQEGLRFTVRDGGRTVGAGQVTKINE